MKYLVSVSRIAPQVKDIEVEAASMKEAKRMALDMAPNLDFGGKESDAEYEIMGATSIPKVK